MFKRFFLLCVFSLIFIIPAAADNLSAKGAALVEQSSGRLLYGKNENTELPMASTTKIMTGLLAVESGRLDTVFTVPPEALRVEGSSMGLLPNEKITLRDLTYGLLLESGNDAANTIAICLAGSIDKFVAQMNHKAAVIGLHDTHFVTPSGLDAPGHYTTAYDLARLGAYAMNNGTFALIVSTQKTRVTYDGNKNGRYLYNHNRMLSMYDGTIGIKTGFTKKCGRCLVTCAKRNGVCLVASTLNGYNDWDDHKKLLDMGFGMLKSETLPVKNPSLAENVVGGVKDTVEASCPDEIHAALQSGEAARVTQQIEMPRFLYAPVKKGQKLGEVVFRLDGKVVARADFRAGSDVAQQPEHKRGGFWRSIGESIASFFKWIF